MPVILPGGDGGEHQNPECLDENGDGDLELRGHEVDAGDCWKPETPAGDLDGQNFFGDEIEREERGGG